MYCWICGSTANSSEHKVKKSVLKKIFAEDFNNKDVIHYKNGKFSKFNSPDSKKIKYDKILCSMCNNDKTQPYDLAYDIFIEYIVNNYELIIEKRIINFSNIYENYCLDNQLNLYKYFTKAFGCDLAQYGFKVPKDMVSLLQKSEFNRKLKISFSINEEMAVVNNPIKGKYGNGWLITTANNLNTKNEINTKYKFRQDLSYLTVNFLYNCYEEVGLGFEWILTKEYIDIGSSNNDKYFYEEIH